MAHSKINLNAMYDWIEACISSGKSLPDDAAIVDRFDFNSTEQARTLLSDLADAGRITIKGYGPDRVITLGRTKPKQPKSADFVPGALPAGLSGGNVPMNPIVREDGLAQYETRALFAEIDRRVCAALDRPDHAAQLAAAVDHADRAEAELAAHEARLAALKAVLA